MALDDPPESATEQPVTDFDADPAPGPEAVTDAAGPEAVTDAAEPVNGVDDPANGVAEPVDGVDASEGGGEAVAAAGGVDGLEAAGGAAAGVVEEAGDLAEVAGVDEADREGETLPAAGGGAAPVSGGDDAERDESERTGEIVLLLPAGEDESDRTGEIVLLAPSAGTGDGIGSEAASETAGVPSAVTRINGSDPHAGQDGSPAVSQEETLVLREAVDPWIGADDRDVTLHLAADPRTGTAMTPEPETAATPDPRTEAAAARDRWPSGSPERTESLGPADPRAAVTRATGSYPVLVRPEVVNEVSGGYPVINSSLTGSTGAYLSLNGNPAAYAALNRASGAYPIVPSAADEEDGRAVGAARVVGPPRRFVGSAQAEISADQAPSRRGDVWIAALVVAVAAVLILGVAYGIAVLS